ncbi:hypothetical protein GCM10009740_34220 [Terrabacter terrae]|uniref:Uncharacterized protein n=1 Tax=Terrabacter terrae TaxID=318434 RepID=A0ABN2UKH5_9MICO
MAGLREGDGDSPGAAPEVEDLERSTEPGTALVGDAAHGRDDGRRAKPSTSLGALLVGHGILRRGTWYAWCCACVICIFTLVP